MSNVFSGKMPLLRCVVLSYLRAFWVLSFHLEQAQPFDCVIGLMCSLYHVQARFLSAFGPCTGFSFFILDRSNTPFVVCLMLLFSALWCLFTFPRVFSIDKRFHDHAITLWAFGIKHH
jgi:hypothetical protein